MVVAVVVVAGIVVLLGLAWWWSGRSRGVEHHSLRVGERGEAEAKALKHYRPNGGVPPGPMLGP